MNKPTEGSWGITKSENGEFYLDEWYVSADGIDGMVAIVNGEANAYRIAAAPEMLEALEEAKRVMGEMVTSFPNTLAIIDAAIAKAKGRA